MTSLTNRTPCNRGNQVWLTQSHIFISLLTYSIEQSPSWEAKRFSASQEIPRILWKRRFITVVTSARHLSLSCASSIQSIPHILLPEHPSKYYPPIYVWVFQVVYFPQVSPPKPCIRLFSPPYEPHEPPISFFSILSPGQYWVRNRDHSAPHYVVSSTPLLPHPS